MVAGSCKGCGEGNSPGLHRIALSNLAIRPRCSSKTASHAATNAPWAALRTAPLSLLPFLSIGAATPPGPGSARVRVTPSPRPRVAQGLVREVEAPKGGRNPLSPPGVSNLTTDRPGRANRREAPRPPAGQCERARWPQAAPGRRRRGSGRSGSISSSGMGRRRTRSPRLLPCVELSSVVSIKRRLSSTRNQRTTDASFFCASTGFLHTSG